MHAIHHTDAFVVKSAPNGEANLRLWLFTESFGLVVATVQGVRKAGAKLAMHTTDYSLIAADLVRGKEVWRLTSAREEYNPFIGKPSDERGRAFVRTLGIIDRFCQGEEAHDALFAHLREAVQTLSLSEEIDVRSFDTILLWKAMVLLGYGTVSPAQQQLFTLPLAEAVRYIDDATRTALIRETNVVIKESHL